MTQRNVKKYGGVRQKKVDDLFKRVTNEIYSLIERQHSQEQGEEIYELICSLSKDQNFHRALKPYEL